MTNQLIWTVEHGGTPLSYSPDILFSGVPRVSLDVVEGDLETRVILTLGPSGGGSIAVSAGLRITQGFARSWDTWQRSLDINEDGTGFFEGAFDGAFEVEAVEVSADSFGGVLLFERGAPQRFHYRVHNHTSSLRRVHIRADTALSPSEVDMTVEIPAGEFAPVVHEFRAPDRELYEFDCVGISSTGESGSRDAISSACDVR